MHLLFTRHMATNAIYTNLDSQNETSLLRGLARRVSKRVILTLLTNHQRPINNKATLSSVWSHNPYRNVYLKSTEKTKPGLWYHKTCHDLRPLVGGSRAETVGLRLRFQHQYITIYLISAETESNQHNNHNTYIKHNTIIYKYYKWLYENLGKFFAV